MILFNRSTIAALLFTSLSLSFFPAALSAAPGNTNSNRMKEAVQAGQALKARARIDLSTPAARKESVRRLKERSQRAKQTAETVARERGWKIRGETSEGVLYELMAIDESGPVYNSTCNVNAAISTSVDRIRNITPYDLSGTGVTVGVWDGGSDQGNHIELAGRVTKGDDSGGPYQAHATHVSGTIGASGLDPTAMGMAPAVEMYACGWGDDVAEMTAIAANTEGSNSALYLSNHSYGQYCGWTWSDASGQEGLHWLGTWGELTDSNFSNYGSKAEQYDTLVREAQYYLPVLAAGNERPGNAPADGDTFYYWEEDDWHSAIYDSSVHPLGDSVAFNGYRTLLPAQTSKNSLVVGAVNDAVGNGIRLPVNGTMSSFSSWGPTEDGRIKPDVVGNGVELRSSAYDEDTPLVNNLYGSASGTSMATPNVTGTAALLTEYYSQRFPGRSMRASTLKGLLIHTADDLGNPGPDYQNGWGLVNGYKAVQLLNALADGLESVQLIEGVRDSNAVGPTSFSFTSACTTPLRVTLVWTDPPGPVLQNDLDLRLISPDGLITFLPFTLSPDFPSLDADRGDNYRDNVEQILVETISQTGSWEIQVSHKGVLYDGLDQPFSVIIETSLGLNDFFYSPQVLTGNSGQLTDCSLSATLETDEPNHGGVSVGKSMWYSWTAIDSGTMYLDTLGSWFNTTLAVYTGDDLAGLIEIAANDDISNEDQHSAVSFAAETGTTYYIAVDGTGGVSSGKVVLNWNLIPYPENDDLLDYEILKAGIAVTGSNLGATVEENEPLHAGSDKGHSVWWKWRSNKEGWVTLDSTGSDIDTAMAVYHIYSPSLMFENLGELASIDNSSKLTFYSGTGSYYIAVASGQNSGDSPEGTISLVLRPANDDLEDALLWEGYENKYEHAFLEGASEEVEDPFYNGQPLYNTIWWTWTAPSGSDMTLKSDAGSPLILGVYTKNEAEELVEVGVGESGNGELIDFRAIRDTQYFILAAGLDEQGAEGLVVRISLEFALVNSLFADAVSLDGSSGQVATDTYGIFENWEGEPDEPLHGGIDNYKSVWWSWSPTEDTFVSFDTFGTSFSTVLAVYTGETLGNLVEVASNNDYGESTRSRVTFCAQRGVNYLIAVTSETHGSGLVILNWEELVDQKLLTLFKDGSGSVLVDGVERTPLWTNWYSACSRVSLEALPDTWQHYHFEEWQDDAAGSEAKIQVTMETSKSIRAVFAQDMQYTVTVASADGGEIYVDGTRFPLPWSGTVYEGNVVLRPIPATDMAFSRWSGDLSSQEMPLILTVTGDVDLIAEFDPRSADKIVTIEPAHDTSLYEDELGETGNGSGDFLFAGDGVGTTRRALIAFDLENGLPADAVITSASLQLVHSAAGAVESTDLFAVRMLKAWGEGSSDASGDELSGTRAEIGDATWLHSLYEGTTWDIPGGDFDVAGGLRGALPLAGPDTYTWLIADGSGSALMLADLQEWQQDPAANTGWGLILENESHPAKRFHSREHPDVNSRPKLELTYYTARTRGPLVSIDPLVTANTKPSLSGRVDDTQATLTVTIDGKSYAAVNEENGEWIIDGGVIDALGFGTYSVTVEAMDSYGNRARDNTDNELSIVKDTFYNKTCVKNYRELQRALALAETNGLNDRIMLEKGVYPVEQNTYYGTSAAFAYNSTEPYSLIVEGGYDSDCLRQERDPEKTVIDGNHLDSVLDFHAEGSGGEQMVRVSNLSIMNGSSSEGGGGKIQAAGVTIQLDNCIVKGNSAANGGGLYLKSLDSPIALANCLLTENSSSGSGAGALLIATNGEITLVNNTVADNPLADSGLGAGLSVSLRAGPEGGGLDITNTIFWGNIIGNDSKASSASIYLDNPDGLPAELHNNLLLIETVEGAVSQESGTLWTENPLFADSLNGDYHLLAGSACIDSGLVSPLVPVQDIDGDARVIAGTCGGELLVDIGADEAPTHADPGNPLCLGSEICYRDSDHDSFGSSVKILDNGDGLCLTADGESTVNSDCEDSKAAIHPGAVELAGDGVDQNCDGTEICFQDSDGDTYGGNSTVTDDGNLSCSDSGESSVDSDCNDSDPGIHPGAAEVVGDGVDQNCDTVELCYRDSDGDGYGTTIIIADGGDKICLAGDGESVVSTDCNDTDPAVYPGATEIAGDGVDQDCSDRDLCYQDSDSDSYGSPVAIEDNGDAVCLAGDGESAVSTDCNDIDPDIYPGAIEIIGDGVDQDCNGTEQCYQDSDRDSYGSTIVITDNGDAICLAGDGESVLSTDCNDLDPAAYPGATEIIGDGVDQDCNGMELCYQDNDGDSYGSGIIIVDDGNLLCMDGKESEVGTDCNDNDSAINPGAVEICDSEDNNCDSLVDENGVCEKGFWLLMLPPIINGGEIHQ